MANAAIVLMGAVALVAGLIAVSVHKIDEGEYIESGSLSQFQI